MSREFERVTGLIQRLEARRCQLVGSLESVTWLTSLAHIQHVKRELASLERRLTRLYELKGKHQGGTNG
jgi:hypothetical protein